MPPPQLTPARCDPSILGYSLTELAIVLAIIGLVAGTTLSVGKVQLDVAEFQGTQERLEILRDALLLFQKKYERYPCPALPAESSTSATYGREAAGGCTTACPAGLTCDTYAVIGAVPFKTLRINEELAYDSWGGKITYAVEKTHAASSSYNQGSISIFDVNGHEITASPALGKAIYVLVSHGEDGKGAYTKAGVQVTACGAVGEDIENCNGDDLFVDSRFNLGDIAANYYDDLILWHTQENATTQEVELRASMASGWEHSCAIKNGGTVMCWGRNNWGQIGDNTTTDRSSPVTAISMTDAVDVAMGGYDSLALKSDGTVWHWDGSTHVPAQANNIGNVVQISAQGTASCALKSDGAVWCTGADWNTWVDQGITDATQIGDGYSHTCALKSDGTVWCWGNDFTGWGDLGDGNCTSSATPVRVSGLTNMVYISQGFPVCAVRRDGTVWCWGDWQCSPSQVPGLTGITAVKVSQEAYHKCALKSDGTVWCWGENQYGQLGNGNTTDQPAPVKAHISGVTEISVGGAGAGTRGFTCVKKTDGTLWCAGYGPVGQLGNGVFSSSTTFVQVQNFP